MRLLLLIAALLVSVPSAAAPMAVERKARAAYESARQARTQLQKDARLRSRRDQWDKVIERFLDVAERWPMAEAAPRSLFNAADLRAELSRVATSTVMLESALKLYQRIADRHAKHPLADDAMMRVARIRVDRQGDLHAGKTALEQILRRWPRGDMKPQARSLLVKLGDVAPARASVARAQETDNGPGGGLKDGPLAKERAGALARANRAAPLAQQLGLSIRRVAIDAGHGGHDTGGLGPGGVREKDIALGIAQDLRRELEAMGLEVVMIRDGDVFVPLAGRARIANETGADLFLSIHCNDADRNRGAGVESYYLDVTSDRYAMRLAARENAESEATVSDLQFILADLATKANVEESSRLASLVQRSLVSDLSRKHGKVKDRGVKHALFYVLLGAKMPAILVETGFLSNAVEAKRLSTPAYQSSVARAIAGGVQKFLGERERLSARL